MSLYRIRLWQPRCCLPAVLFLLGLLLPALLRAAEPRPMQAQRLSGAAPRIDGLLDEEVWLTAPRFSGFTQREPD
ncbi:MAG: hypothetical protein IT369_18805, partial [Candidatus Latescibacteria bacterium]|nr:hypothetical protein [Candidatus Latescibacterota bacterium]